jgi:general secretion pathway protein K
LIAVLWLSAALASIALGYATTARMNALSTLNAQQMLQVSSVIHSGLDMGVHHYKTYARNPKLFNEPEVVQELVQAGVELWYPRHEPYPFVMNGFRVWVRVSTAKEKFDISAINNGLWEQILTACGIPEPSQRTAIINSIRDWQDKDDSHRLDGAENDFYRKERGYDCKNHELEHTGELLLIKGVTPELYLGTENHPGLRDFINCYGGNSRIDVNCASPWAFDLIKDFPRDAVQAIVESRQVKPLQDMDEVMQMVPAGYASAFKRFFTLSSADELLIEASRSQEPVPGEVRYQRRYDLSEG